MMKQLSAALLTCGLLVLQPAMAHGTNEPRHGGIVQVVNDINFELVVEADGATIYLMDHGRDMPSKGISGKLTVLTGDKTTEVDLKAGDGNKLQATGVKIGKGAKVVAVLGNAAGRSLTVRFAVQ